MNVKEFLKVDADTLKKQQFEVLKQAVVEHIERVRNLVQQEEWESIEGLLSFSPSGDCMGCDNHYISFDHLVGRDADISEVIEKLKRLQGK